MTAGIRYRLIEPNHVMFTHGARVLATTYNAANATGVSTFTVTMAITPKLSNTASAGRATFVGTLAIARKLKAVSAGSVSTSATLHAARKMAANAGSVSTSVVALRVARKLTAVNAGTSTSVMTLVVAWKLAVVSAGKATSVVTLAVARKLTATTTSVSTSVVTLAVLRKLAASSAGSATGLAAVSVARKMVGVGAGVATSAVTARVTRKLTATVASTSALQVDGFTVTRFVVAISGLPSTLHATLLVARKLTVLSAGKATGAAAASATRKLAMANVTGASTSAVVLAVARKLKATVTSVSASVATLTVARHLVLAPHAVATVNMNARVAWKLTAPIAGHSTSTSIGTLFSARNMTATSAAVASSVATYVVARRLVPTSHGTSTTTMNARAAWKLTAAAADVSTVTMKTGVVKKLTATSVGISTPVVTLIYGPKLIATGAGKATSAATPVIARKLTLHVSTIPSALLATLRIARKLTVASTGHSVGNVSAPGALLVNRKMAVASAGVSTGSVSASASLAIARKLTLTLNGVPSAVLAALGERRALKAAPVGKAAVAATMTSGPIQYQNFNGGTDNTGTLGAVTAANSGLSNNGLAFTLVNIAGGGSISYVNLPAASPDGTLSAQIVNVSGQINYMQYTVPSSGAVAMHAYVYLHALPSGVVRLLDIRNSVGTILRAQTDATNQLCVQEGGGTTTLYQNGPLLAATLYRIEMLITNISATTGTYQLDYYLGNSPDSLGGTQIVAGNLGTSNIVSLVFGQNNSNTTPVQTNYDAIAYNLGASTYIGPPAGVLAAGRATATASMRGARRMTVATHGKATVAAAAQTGSNNGWLYGANGTYQPTATTSGVPAGTVLTAHTGSYTITTAGTMISAMQISGGIDIKAANVIISSCLVKGPASAGSSVIDCRWTGCVNAVVEDSETAATTWQTYLNSCMGHDVTWQRCNIHGGTDGVRSATNNNGAGVQASGNANAHLLSNYIHGLAGWLVDPAQSNNPSHNDPWQPEGGNNNTAIGNNFDGRIDPTLGGGTANASNWNGGNHPSTGALNTNSCIQWDVNTTSTITSGCVMNNNWFDYGYIQMNGAFANGAANHFDSIQNNLFGHHSTSGLQINLVGTTVGTLSGNAFVDGVGTITVHS